MKKFLKVFDSDAAPLVRLLSGIKIVTSLFASWALVLGVFLLLIIAGGVTSTLESDTDQSGSGFNGTYSRELPMYDEIKGTAAIPEDVAKLAVGAAVKYKQLPSVILSQWAYESEWGRSYAAKNDQNYFGITWYAGCPFPQGSPRGLGGSEGGFYMKFPDKQSSFSFYGFMIATQSNFNASVGKKNPGEVLLILGRGGYAEAGITETSAYYTGCMSIIKSNKLVETYDEFAIKRWQDSVPGGSTNGSTPGIGNSALLEKVLGQTINGGQCYGLTAYYVSELGGPQLMGSGKINASDIGSDYPWESYGWVVIFNPMFSDFQPGDVINYKAYSALAPTQYGHTAVIASVQGNGQYTNFEQNAERGQIVAKYNRTDTPGSVCSLVRKVK